MTQEMTVPGAELYCPTCEQHYPVGELCPDDGTRLVRLGQPVDPFVGRELDGRYTIIEKLGQGGMGAVYRARQHSMGREVAVKVVNQSIVADAHSIKRFLREAKLVSRLAHPNVVAVLDFGQAVDGVFYLVMELVEGRTLHDALNAEGRLSLPRIVRIAAQICDALEGAHRMPIVHRDLKPANIMLLSAGRDLVKVLDFGLAKSLAIDNTSITMTSGGALLGTPTFMPPEVANGETFIDGRADLYSLGCILYVMGAGRPPFISDSIPELISMHGVVPAPPMTGVPAPLARVVDRLLLKDPAARYQNAAETREAIEAAFEEIRTRGMFADTIDEELVPVEGSAVTLDSEVPGSAPPDRPSELRTTNVFASQQLDKRQLPLPPLPPTPSPTTGQVAKVIAAGASASMAPTSLPPATFAASASPLDSQPEQLPPTSVRSPSPAVAASSLAQTALPRRMRIGTMIAILAVLAAVGVGIGLLVTGGGGAEEPAVAPSTGSSQSTSPSAPQTPVPVSPGPVPATGSGSAVVDVDVPPVDNKPPSTPPIVDRPQRKRPGAGKSSPAGKGSATDKRTEPGTTSGSAVDPGASPF